MRPTDVAPHSKHRCGYSLRIDGNLFDPALYNPCMVNVHCCMHDLGLQAHIAPVYYTVIWNVPGRTDGVLCFLAFGAQRFVVAPIAALALYGWLLCLRCCCQGFARLAKPALVESTLDHPPQFSL
eukprot:1574343-Lingulodinium_polyedra.AAC.2